MKKSLRLKHTADFDRVYKAGRQITEKHLQLFFLNLRGRVVANQNAKRFGFVVSKRAAPKIVQRNRMKRVLRAMVQAKLEDFRDGYDFILQAKRNVANLSMPELKYEFDQLLKKLQARS